MLELYLLLLESTDITVTTRVKIIHIFMLNIDQYFIESINLNVTLNVPFLSTFMNSITMNINYVEEDIMFILLIQMFY